MAISRVNFEPVGSVLSVDKRAFPLADPTLLIPSHAQALVDGEWVTLNASSKIVRGADITVLGTGGAAGRASTMCYPWWMERGRTDAQATSDGIGAIYYLGTSEFDVKIFDAAAVVASGAAITTVHQAVKVATISLSNITGSARNFVGLVGHGGSGDAAPVAGFVSRLPANNGGKLRVIWTSPSRWF